MGFLFPAFLFDFLLFFLYFGIRDYGGFDCFRGRHVCRFGTHAERCRTVAFRGKDHSGALRRMRVGRCRVRAHRTYVANLTRHLARALCCGGIGLYPPEVLGRRGGRNGINWIVEP